MGSDKLTFINHFYVGQKASQLKEEILRAIDRKTTIPGMYLITYASNDVDQLDIVEGKNLLRKKVYERLPKIVGIAVTKTEAFELVEEMARDSYRVTGKCDLCAYLRMRDRGEVE